MYRCHFVRRESSDYMRLKRKANEAVRERKIFTVYGRDAKHIRKALLNRGWVEKLAPKHLISKLNINLSKISQQTTILSSFLHNCVPNLIWSGKLLNQPNGLGRSNSYQEFLINNQLQLPNNIYRNKKVKKNNHTIVSKLKVRVKNWSSKTGLCTSLKNTSWYYIEDVAEVHVPRTYINTDNDDMTDFVNDYCLTACTSLLRWILDNFRNSEPIFRRTGIIPINVMVFALNRCKEHLNNKVNKDIDGNKCRAISRGRWNSFIKKHKSLITGRNVFKMDNEPKILLLVRYADYLLKEILIYRPELKCDGYRNVWIIKPSHLSMGEGIRLSSELNTILKMLTTTKKGKKRTTNKYVVQKYIGKNYST